MTANGTERAIGQLQASVEILSKQHSDTAEKVDILIAHMERQKGGWKVAALVAGGVGSVAGYVSRFISQ